MCNGVLCWKLKCRVYLWATLHWVIGNASYLEFCNTVVSRWDIKHCAVCGRGEVRYQLTMFIQFRQHASVLGRLSCYSQLCYSEVRSILNNRCMSSHSFYFKQFVTRFVEAVQFGCTDSVIIKTWVDFLLRHKTL